MYDSFPKIKIYFCNEVIELGTIINHVISESKRVSILRHLNSKKISFDVNHQRILTNEVILTRGELIISAKSQVMLEKCHKKCLEMKKISLNDGNTLFQWLTQKAKKISATEILTHYKFNIFFTKLQKAWLHLVMFHELKKLQSAGLTPFFVKSKFRSYANGGLIPEHKLASCSIALSERK